MSNSKQYGFEVGDPVCHVKDYSVVGFVTEIDYDADCAGITTCRVVWDAVDFQDAMNTPREDQDIQWTNKVILKSE